MVSGLKGKLFSPARYREAQVLADLDKLQGIYRAVGYLDAVVDRPEIAFGEKRRTVRVIIRIDEGERTFVRSVSVAGNELFVSDELTSAVQLEPGAPFNPALLFSDAYRIYTRYADVGQPYAKVVPDSQLVADSADVSFTIDEGPIAHVGSIRLVGNTRTLGKAIERELLIREGDVFSRRKILESQARLYRTGLFSAAKVEAPGLEDTLTTLDLIVRVKERQQRWIGFGVGYGTLDFLRLSGDWNHRNLFGSLIQAEIEVVVSRLLSDQDSNFRGDLILTDPWLLGTRTEGALSFFHEEREVLNFEFEDDEGIEQVVDRYRLRETGTRFNVSRELARRTRGSVGFNLTTTKPSEISQPIDPEELGREQKRSVDATVERNGRDNPFDPRRGTFLRGVTELAGGPFGGDSEFLRGRGSATLYRPGILGSVVAARLEVGSVRTLTDADAIPDHERFRVGGGTSVRGYDEEGIGPGNFLLVSNLEWRVPLFWKVSSAFFLDGGNTWGELSDVRGEHFRLDASRDEIGGGDVRYSVGSGVRLATPVGPARVDWGYKLKREQFPDGRLEDPWALHLSLGQPF